MIRGRHVLLLSLFSIFQAGIVFAVDNPWDAKLPFESGIITYDVTGMEEGSEVLYIKEFGKRTATYRTTLISMMGMKVENSTVKITDQDWVYSYDLGEKRGTKSVNVTKYIQQEYEKLSETEKKRVLNNSDKIAMSAMGGHTGSVEENAAVILGQSCDRSSAMGSTTYCIHKTAIPLKTELNIMGQKMTVVATSFDTGKVDDKYFAHPVGIVATHDEQADKLARQMASQTIAWLKDPQSADAPPIPSDVDTSQPKITEEEQEMIKEAEQMMKGLKGLLGN